MVTYSFASGGPVRHNEHNTNFADVEALAKSVGNSQLLGGITADKLSDRYSLDTVHAQLVPVSLLQALATTGVTNAFDVPNALTSLWKFKPVLKDGYESFLCAVQFYVLETLQNGASGPGWPKVAIYRNTDLLGGQAVTFDVSNDYYILANQDPVVNPLSALANGDYLDFQIGRDGSAGTPRIRGLQATLVFKHVLLP